jgi:hypothetical protein
MITVYGQNNCRLWQNNKSHGCVNGAFYILTYIDVTSLYCELPEAPIKQCSLLQEEEEAALAALADDLPSSPESKSKMYTLTKGTCTPATVITGSHNEHNSHTTLHLTAHWLIPISNAYAWWYSAQSMNAVHHHNQTLLSSKQMLAVWQPSSRTTEQSLGLDKTPTPEQPIWNEGPRWQPEAKR